MDNQIVSRVEEALAPTIESMGFEVVDVEYVKRADGMNLTIYIDIPRGVTINDCEAVHNAVNPIIDNLNPTNDAPYIFNISSPGLDRPFKKLRDYERNYGREVEVKLYAPLKGKKVYEGVLLEKTDNLLRLQCNGKETTIETNRVALVRPLVKFE
ncbi:MAG: ribosome maturation factor RimP [Clostridiales bacterium]|nr:ribosome maturation factor RimP [Clostridiales bacterium]